MADGATLDQELGQLLEQETFPPPEEFRERAVVSDAWVFDAAEADPEGFWAQQAEALHWDRKWDQVLDWSNPPFAKWFLGGKLNVSYNCLDRHVEAGRGERVAFHWRGEEGEERDISYAQLHADVQRFANALKDRGIGPGDVVGIYLPMIPEVAVAMLACARIGAIHNVVFGGFSPESVRETARAARVAPPRSRSRWTRSCPTCRASSCATSEETRRWRARTPGSTS
jgi:acetyl-CoA synthetase